MTPGEVALVGVFGLMVGSFLNVVIARLPAGGSLLTPASHCPSCRTPIRWIDNIPLLSYAVLGGRCRSCRAGISVRYPLVEAATAALFVGQAFVVQEPGVELAARLLLTSLLVALAVTDLETFRLPNPLTIGGLVVGIALSMVTPVGVANALYGAALGAGILLLIRWGWLAATGTDAMGLGDVKMLAMVGAFLGWAQIFVVLLLSTLAGAVIGIVIAGAGRGTMRTKLPFGVFLAIAAYIASVTGEALLAWYLNLLIV